MPKEKIAAAVGSTCWMWNVDGVEGYSPYVITSAAATDDPCVVAIEIEPKQFFSLA